MRTIFHRVCIFLNNKDLLHHRFHWSVLMLRGEGEGGICFFVQTCFILSDEVQCSEINILFSGVVQVTIHEDPDGYMTLVAHPPQLRKNSLSSSLPSLYDDVLQTSSTAIVEEGGQSDSELEKCHNSCLVHENRSHHRYMVVFIWLTGNLPTCHVAPFWLSCLKTLSTEHYCMALLVSFIHIYRFSVSLHTQTIKKAITNLPF